MAKNKLSLKFEGIDDLMDKLDKIGGTQAMKQATEQALIESQKYIAPKVEKALQKNNLPRKGKYGDAQDLRDAIVKDEKVTWEGLTASINVGIDFSTTGMKQIYLMHGTKKMKPVRGLKSAICGSKSKKEVEEIQRDTINKAIKKIMEG